MRFISTIIISAILSIVSIFIIFNVINNSDIFNEPQIIANIETFNSSSNIFKISLDLNEEANYDLIINNSGRIKNLRTINLKKTHQIEVNICNPGSYNLTLKVCNILNKCEFNYFNFNSLNSVTGDNDNDYIDNICDNCNSVINSDQTDTNDDGVGDACDD